MDFDLARKKTLREIIEDDSTSRDRWTETAFMKLIDAKIGEEISFKLNALIGGLSVAIETNEKIGKEVSDRLLALVGSMAAAIESNEKLAKSNDRYSNALCWLTGGLILVGLLQIFIPFFISR